MPNIVKLKLQVSTTDILLAEEVLSSEDLDTLLFGCTDSEDTLLSNLIKVISFASDCKKGMKFVVRANKNLEREVVEAYIYCKKHGRNMRIGVLQFFDTINCADKKVNIIVEVM